MDCNLKVDEFGQLVFSFSMAFDVSLVDQVIRTKYFIQNGVDNFSWSSIISPDYLKLALNIILELFNISLDYNNGSNEFTNLDIKAITLITALEEFVLIG